MAKLHIMQGLPGSGKTTKAEEIMLRDGNAVRINKDSLRAMLHFGKWSGKNEELTRKAARALAATFLELGKNVIIDDTNLNLGTLQGWKDLAKDHRASIEYHVINTPVTECIDRDAAREEGHVGSSVIVGMAMQSGLYPKPALPVVICDIDGTLADTDHRAHFVAGEKKDWKSFFAAAPQDPVRREVLAMLMKYAAEGREIFFVSGRPDNYREQTEAWLDTAFNAFRGYQNLFMRRAGDSRADTIVKQEIYDNYFKNKYPVGVVIDDRPSVIRMWRSNDLEVIDVGKGIEF